MHDVTDKIMVSALVVMLIPLVTYLCYIIITGKEVIDDGNDMEGDSIYAI